MAVVAHVQRRPNVSAFKAAVSILDKRLWLSTLSAGREWAVSYIRTNSSVGSDNGAISRLVPRSRPHHRLAAANPRCFSRDELSRLRAFMFFDHRIGEIERETPIWVAIWRRAAFCTNVSLGAGRIGCKTHSLLCQFDVACIEKRPCVIRKQASQARLSSRLTLRLPATSSPARPYLDLCRTKLLRG